MMRETTSWYLYNRGCHLIKCNAMENFFLREAIDWKINNNLNNLLFSYEVLWYIDWHKYSNKFVSCELRHAELRNFELIASCYANDCSGKRRTPTSSSIKLIKNMKIKFKNLLFKKTFDWRKSLNWKFHFEAFQFSNLVLGTTNTIGRNHQRLNVFLLWMLGRKRVMDRLERVCPNKETQTFGFPSPHRFRFRFNRCLRCLRATSVLSLFWLDCRSFP